MRAPASSLVRCSFVALGAALLPAPATPQCGMAKLFASDAANGTGFGNSGMALDRGRLFVAATQPTSVAVYVFEDRAGAWSEVAKLERSWPGFYDAFGKSLDASGEMLVVGGPGDGTAAMPGLVYVFEETSAGWLETARIEPPAGGARDRFGASVSLDGSTLVVGAPGDDRFGTDAGAAFVYELDATGWSLEAILAPPAPGSVLFGTSVAVDAGRVLVGAPLDEKGSAHVYRRAADEWRLEQSLTFQGSHGHPGDDFGWRVALDGDRAAFGAPAHGCLNTCSPSHLDDRAGAVLVFARGSDGWTFDRELRGSGHMWERGLGWSLAMDAGMAVAGGPFRELAGVFRLWLPLNPSTTKGSLLETATVYDAGEYYGWSVAIDERWIAVTAPGDDEAGHGAGAVYLYERRDDQGPPYCCVGIGHAFCTPPEPYNGTLAGWLTVDGSEDTADDCLFLHMGGLNGPALGWLLMGSRSDPVAVPGHVGPLCIGSGPRVLRLTREPLDADGDEVISRTVGTRSIPGLSTGIVPGSSWSFQGWYRMGTTMGFTDAVELTFR